MKIKAKAGSQTGAGCNEPSSPSPRLSPHFVPSLLIFHSSLPAPASCGCRPGWRQPGASSVLLLPPCQEALHVSPAEGANTFQSDRTWSWQLSQFSAKACTTLICLRIFLRGYDAEGHTAEVLFHILEAACHFHTLPLSLMEHCR